MTTPTPEPRPRVVAALEALTEGQLDALTLVIGAVLITLAIGAVDWRAGMFTAGLFCLGEVLVDRLMRRSRR